MEFIDDQGVAVSLRLELELEEVGLLFFSLELRRQLVFQRVG